MNPYLTQLDDPDAVARAAAESDAAQGLAIPDSYRFRRRYADSDSPLIKRRWVDEQQRQRDLARIQEIDRRRTQP